MNRDRRFLDAHESAAILLHRNTGAGYLASASLAAQPDRRFLKLGNSRKYHINSYI